MIDELDAKNPKPVAKKQPLLLVVPVWALALAAAVGALILLALVSGMRGTASQVQEEINILRSHEIQAREASALLASQIAEAESPGIIHSIAVNRLNMFRPSGKDVIIIPRPDDVAPVDDATPPEDAQGSLLDYLLGLLGL